jgi:hypothetical protein
MQSLNSKIVDTFEDCFGIALGSRIKPAYFYLQHGRVGQEQGKLTEREGSVRLTSLLR